MLRLNTTANGILRKILLYMALILIWELAYKLGVEYIKVWNPIGVPSPFNVAKTFVTLTLNHTLGIAVLTSMVRVVIGYSISLMIGLIVAFMMSRFKFLKENFSSLILGFQTLPSICWVPFAVLWFGLSESAIIFVVVIGSVFAITLGIESAIDNVQSIYLKAAKTMGAKGLKAYKYVVLPAALPGIISGMKQGWAFAWRGLIAGEMLSRVNGLGQVLILGQDNADLNQIIAIMVVIIVLGLTVNMFIFEKVEANIRERWGLDNG